MTKICLCSPRPPNFVVYNYYATNSLPVGISYLRFLIMNKETDDLQMAGPYRTHLLKGATVIIACKVYTKKILSHNHNSLTAPTSHLIMRSLWIHHTFQLSNSIQQFCDGCCAIRQQNTQKTDGEKKGGH